MDLLPDDALNRWTLVRQLLMERQPLDAVAGVGHLAGMQAQHPPSPYIGLWSRLVGFERPHLEQALQRRSVVKVTVMRGTLHLVPTRRLPHFRLAAGSSYYESTLARLRGLGVDLAAIRARVTHEVAARPHSRTEVSALITSLLPDPVPHWVHDRPSAIAAVSVTTDLVNAPEDAMYGAVGRSRYAVAPVVPEVPRDEAIREVVATYLRAFGPASSTDIARWSGSRVQAFAPALEELGVTAFRAEDGRTLLDLPDAPRPSTVGPVPARFLPKWDNLLLAYDRRDRVLPEPYRRVVIAKNGDVAPTFLVDGKVAGTWAAPVRGPATLTLKALGAMSSSDRDEVYEEGTRLLNWLRPDESAREVRWE